MHIAQVVKSTHDPPDGSEQPHVGTGGADGRQQREVLLQSVQLAQLRHTHGSLRPGQLLLDGRPQLAQPAELAVARLEHTFEPRARASLDLDAAVERRQIAARPECFLELGGLTPRPRNDLAFAQYDRPRHHRCQQQQSHDRLHDRACIQHQIPHRQVIGHRATP